MRKDAVRTYTLLHALYLTHLNLLNHATHNIWQRPKFHFPAEKHSKKPATVIFPALTTAGPLFSGGYWLLLLIKRILVLIYSSGNRRAANRKTLLRTERLCCEPKDFAANRKTRVRVFQLDRKELTTQFHRPNTHTSIQPLPT